MNARKFVFAAALFFVAGCVSIPYGDEWTRATVVDYYAARDSLYQPHYFLMVTWEALEATVSATIEVSWLTYQMHGVNNVPVCLRRSVEYPEQKDLQRCDGWSKGL